MYNESNKYMRCRMSNSVLLNVGINLTRRETSFESKHNTRLIRISVTVYKCKLSLIYNPDFLEFNDIVNFI